VRVAAGGNHPELVEEADRFFVSPGVPETSPVYVAAIGRGLQIESMTTLFFDLCPGPIVGITGSSGKTTTTGLIGHILQAAGRDVAVGGNIGDPMLDLLSSLTPHTTVVLELSSFQLGILRRSPHVAVVTNISPNHLDRHGTMEAYIAAKRNIVAHQVADDIAILNADDPAMQTFASATPASLRWFGSGSLNGATARDGQVGLIAGGGFRPVIPIEQIPLLGRHNVENVQAAVAVAGLLEIPIPDTAAAIRSYHPAPHRLELVGVRGGVRYIDDSIATSPARAMVALEAIDAPVLLIAGGRDKQLPWEAFARLAAQKVRAVYLIGEAADAIESVMRDAARQTPGELSTGAIFRAPSLEAAVRLASRQARPGDVVLLSPGCTSYDMFSDFSERGAAFARAVERLDAA
jgi:UDP-N-acetylmuramoylalanine--D-glutamate ligase